MKKADVIREFFSRDGDGWQFIEVPYDKDELCFQNKEIISGWILYNFAVICEEHSIKWRLVPGNKHVSIYVELED